MPALVRKLLCVNYISTSWIGGPECQGREVWGAGIIVVGRAVVGCDRFVAYIRYVEVRRVVPRGSTRLYPLFLSFRVDMRTRISQRTNLLSTTSTAVTVRESTAGWSPRFKGVHGYAQAQTYKIVFMVTYPGYQLDGEL